MLRDLVQYGPFGPGALEAADRLLADLVPRRLSSCIYPQPAFSREEEKRLQGALDDTRFAQPALGVVNLFANDVLSSFGLSPAFTAGHSYGEYVALCIGGGCGREDLLRLSALRGQAVYEAGRENPGAMAAVTADEPRTRAVLDELGLPLHLANLNAPNQTIIAGPTEAIQAALEAFRKHRLAIRRIPVTAAFHTPAMEEPLKAFAAHLEKIDLCPTRLPVYSNVSAEPYPADITRIRHQLAIHLARPVRFVEQIRSMHRDGARIFIETGPGRILTGLVKRILAGEEHETLALDMPGQPGWLPLGQLLARAAAIGLPVDPAPWFQDRGLDLLSCDAYLERARRQAEGRSTDWILSPSRARPVREATGVAAAQSRDETSALPPPAHAVSQHAGAPVAADVRVPASDSSTSRDGMRSMEPGASGTDPVLVQLQENMSRWLELHKENQRLSARFLELQERIVERLLAGRGAGSEPEASTSPPALAVAPAPVLPKLTPTHPSANEQHAPAGEMLRATGQPDAYIEPPVEEAVRSGTPAVPSVVAAASADAAATEGSSAPEGDKPAIPTEEQFRRDLLAEVSKRTGYPEDTLDPDLALEAGLGIDSIKIMEIFSALKPYHHILADEDQDEEEVLVQFTEMKTLRHIVEHYAARRKKFLSGEAVAGGNRQDRTDDEKKEEVTVSAAGDAESEEQRGEKNEDMTASVAGAEGGADAGAARRVARVERLILRPAPAPPRDSDAGAAELDAFPRDQILLVLGDAPELAASVEAALASRGFRAIQVLPAKAFCRVNAQRYEVDLADRASVEELARTLGESRDGRVGALINLLALGSRMSQPGLDGYDVPLDLIQSLANVARVFESDLRESARAGGGRLVNVTTLDGRFGLRGDHDLPVAQAGSLGFFKSLAREWRGVRVKTIDLDPQADPRHLVVGLLRELASWDDLLEVGLDGDGRWRLVLVPESVSADGGEPATGSLLLDREAVVLVTGGARGITAEFAKRLARQTRARLILVGRSPLRGPEDEPAGLRDLTEESALRGALVEGLRSQGQEVIPAEVERTLRRIRKDRVMRENLSAMRAAGSEVEYHSLDVRDTDRFEALIGGLYDRFGRLDGVIHGAGVVEDGWLRNKDPESVARVFDTKVRGGLVLARKLRPEGLRFLVFFSSLSGRLGNAGQVDYSAANEFLNKLAAHLDREWPGRVVAINWGPWDTGMMSAGLRAAYKERGIDLIPVDAGVESLLAELRRTSSGEPEVILTCSPRELAGLA
jgi:acyl transferase domain-containing protein/short-subunit dehydrogenase